MGSDQLGLDPLGAQLAEESTCFGQVPDPFGVDPHRAEERRLLRERFGIEEPNRLYLSDSTSAGYLVYDTERDPGAGRLVIESVQRRDYPVLQGFIIFIALAYSLINLLVDISYSLIDPRVRVQ